VKDREEILAIHAKKRPLEDDVDLEEVAQGTPGFSGADLENLINEAAILAARAKKQKISMDDITEARDKVLLGLERRNITMSDEEKKKVAFHESGHAVLAAMLPNTDPLYKVTIIPRDKAMGVTMQLPEGDRHLYSKEYLQDRLAVMLAGRASEDIIFNSVTTGAENDFREATKLARQMVSAWGMSEKLGTLASAGEQRNVFLGEELSRGREFSEHTAQTIDAEIQRFLNDAYDRAKSTLNTNREGLEKLAQTLQEREQLSAEEVLEILGIGTDGQKSGAKARKKKSAQAAPDGPEAASEATEQDRDSSGKAGADEKAGKETKASTEDESESSEDTQEGGTSEEEAAEAAEQKSERENKG
jgi:cell division protease FtsH